MILDFSPRKPGKLHLDFRCMVYMRNRTHSYLWLRDEEDMGIFLTMDSGIITVEHLDKVTVYERDERGQIISQSAVYRVFENKELYEDLTEYPYDPMRALRIYHSSLLDRTPEAESELCRLLEISPKGPQKRVTGVTPPMGSSKPAKSSSPRPVGSSYSLADLCSELKIDPAEARKILRSKNVAKPGNRWEWPSREAALPVQTALTT